MNHRRDLLFGLLAPRSPPPTAIAVRCRDFTLSWSRYGYRDEIVEAPTVDGILQLARERGRRYCWIQRAGHVIRESWVPTASRHGNFHAALAELLDGPPFLAVGHILEAEGAWFGLHDRCLLVDLEVHDRCGRPPFLAPAPGERRLPRPTILERDGRTVALCPSDEDEQQSRPVLPGWPWIAASLRQGLSLPGFGPELQRHTLWLEPDSPSRSAAFARYLDSGIERYRGERHHEGLSADQSTFLDSIERHTTNARRGVFLWNVESYEDIEEPPAEFRGPISSLYSVAAGFKPNRILQTHGFDERTRVLFFDWSPRALAIRRWLVEHWDGSDFPDLVSQLFRTFPAPETFYHLWADRVPDEVEREDVCRRWSEELAAWGGERAFRRHWQDYRRLRHEYLVVDLLAEPDLLLSRVEREPAAVIWWSNAFFTVSSNWHRTIEERFRLYTRWLEALAAKCPEAWLYGSDAINTCVNAIQARAYDVRFQEATSGRRGAAGLEPCKLQRQEIRM